MKKFIINAGIVFLGILLAVLVVADIVLVGAAIEHREYTYFIAAAVLIAFNVLIWTAAARLFKKSVQIRHLEEQFENEFKPQQSQKSISSQDDAKCLCYAASSVDTTPMKRQSIRENRAAADGLQHMMGNEKFIHYTELKFAHNELYIQALKYVGRDTDTAAAPISVDKLASKSDDCAIAVYVNGRMIRTIPPVQGDDYYKERQVFYNARYIISDNILYDLYNAETNKTMHIPEFEKIDGMFGDVTADIVYVLRKKAAMMFDKRELVRAAAELIKRTTDFIPYRSFSSTEKDCMRSPELLFRYGLFDEAEKEIEKCKKIYHDLMKNAIFQHTPYYFVNNQKYHDMYYYDGSDLVSSDTASRCCCDECAKYRWRVYSYYGKDKRFPVLPDKLKSTEYFMEHIKCNLSFFPFIIGADSFQDKTNTHYISEDVDRNDIKRLIEISNRPFVDDRREDELDLWEKHNEKSRYDYSFNLDKHLGMTYIEYCNICDMLPALAPKSITGYRRMKTQQSTGYIKIKQAAAEAGLILND